MYTSTIEVMERPVESAQFDSVRFTERREEIGAAPSIGQGHEHIWPESLVNATLLVVTGRAG